MSIDEIRKRWGVKKWAIDPDGDHSTWQARDDFGEVFAALDAATAERDAALARVAALEDYVVRIGVAIGGELAGLSDKDAEDIVRQAIARHDTLWPQRESE